MIDDERAPKHFGRVNRRERRKQASEARRSARREVPIAADPAAPVATLEPAMLERLEGEVQSRLTSPFTEEGAVRAAAAGSDAMDEALALVWKQSGKGPACARGCAYCCTQGVAVTAPEVIRMVSHATQTLPPGDLERIRERAARNALLTHGTTVLGYPPRLDCAFLGDDRACLVHAARPLMCRREHAMDAADCKQGYDLAAPGVDHPIVRLVRAKLASDEVLDAYRYGLAAAGADPSYYELQEAAHIALSVPGSSDAWLAGSAAFATARFDQTEEPSRIPTPRAPRRRLPVA
jgi:Fe-S-cluster containining protein